MYPKAKYAIPDKHLGPCALRRDYKPGVLLLTDPVRGSFLVSCLQSQAPHTIFVAPNSPTTTSFLCESSFFSLMERLCIIQLSVFAQRGRPKNHCSKDTFLLLFQQHYVYSTWHWQCWFLAHSLQSEERSRGSQTQLIMACQLHGTDEDPQFYSWLIPSPDLLPHYPWLY